jgi:rod shape-determining protein MreD
MSPRGLVFFFLVGVVFLVWETTAQTWISPRGFGPNLSLLYVIYMGLFTPLTSGAVIVTLFGFLYDGVTGGFFGLYTGIFLAVFFITALLRQQLDPSAPWYLALFIWIFVVGAYALTMIVLYLLDRSLPIPALSLTSPALPFLVSSGLTAIIGPPVFWVLGIFRIYGGALLEEES